MTQSVIEKLVEQIFSTGKITCQEREQIKTALLDEVISNADLNAIERVIEGFRSGEIEVVFESNVV